MHTSFLSGAGPGGAPPGADSARGVPAGNAIDRHKCAIAALIAHLSSSLPIHLARLAVPNPRASRTAWGGSLDTPAFMPSSLCSWRGDSPQELRQFGRAVNGLAETIK